ncbi:CDP-glycerol glycerophosphotransferase family protein [Actinomadura barringtoniae]|uniref:CDP-glycerol glycerophosphotransferase family protein n=1 Tax=Actinomadura barringtoniae TaxID=1427535 RepID=A0A939PRB6_9ACTN|nr:CDP-glycerol glycerophosphotransferase family protein [Actinomadura barringtoniae]MBO2454769.1 CDP-glycerol glycerophosphotransferase family protein [Actinomadura barringtoniae]
MSTAVSAVLIGGDKAKRTAGSLRAQTLRNVEVVMDASKASEASGAYVLFVEAGRRLDRHACMTMLNEAERGDAQIVLGNDSAARLYSRAFLSETGVWPTCAETAAAVRAAATRVVELPHRVVHPDRPSALGGLKARLRKAPRVLMSTKLKRRAYDTVFRRLPIQKGLVVFDSSITGEGSGLRAVHEQLLALGRPHRAAWAHGGDATGCPGRAARVRRSSWAYYWTLARAEFWVADQEIPAHIAKRAGTTYIQTGLGAPVEFAGLDAPAMKMSTRAAAKRLRQRMARFDAVIVGSEHEERVVKDALCVDAEVLRIGQPRNDVLLNGTGDDRMNRVRDALDIPDDVETIVLYAPAEPVGVDLDLAVLAEELGPDHALVYRSPGKAIEAIGALGHPVFDASAIEDLPALLLLADVLITDHAPVMFDFVLLDRPMIFHVPPAATERLRRTGGYLDPERDGPGPVTNRPDELAEAILAHETFGELYRAARRSFRLRFASFEEGAAAETVADLLTRNGADGANGANRAHGATGAQ